jgi:CotS family spore coat protein
MSYRKLIENAVVNQNEKKMISYAMGKYNIEVNTSCKIRSVYKITSNTGVLCLKKIKHGHKKVQNSNNLVLGLKNAGFSNVSSFLKTKNGELSVKYNKYTLYVTEWIDGEECQLENLPEILNCTKLLAQFHLAANKIDTKTYKLHNNLKDWPSIFNSNLHDLEKFKDFIARKKIKNEFDHIYDRYIDKFYSRGINALNTLISSDYHKLSRQAYQNKTLCHDSFYYQNIIKKSNNEYYIIDLDSVIIDLQVMDLGKFIRRLMTKSDFQWNFSKARYIIEAYHNEKPLSAEELEVMLALIIFPHKFWKLGRKRYIKQKNWSENKYMHKLEKVIKYSDLEQNFIYDYQNFIDEFKVH